MTSLSNLTASLQSRPGSHLPRCPPALNKYVGGFDAGQWRFTVLGTEFTPVPPLLRSDLKGVRRKGRRQMEKGSSSPTLQTGPNSIVIFVCLITCFFNFCGGSGTHIREYTEERRVGDQVSRPCSTTAGLRGVIGSTLGPKITLGGQSLR